MPDLATGRRRNPATHDAILDATAALLDEIGFDKLSLEGVAARARVGKATIYRWWSSKSALAMEALLRELGPCPGWPETASARADIEHQLHQLATLYRGKSGALIGKMIGLAQFDGDTMRRLQSDFLDPLRSAVKQVLHRGIANGEFKADLNPDSAFDLLYGPLIQRLLMRHTGIEPIHIESHLALALDGIAASTPAHGASPLNVAGP
jgi:AcrR family transcriptional regulator